MIAFHAIKKEDAENGPFEEILEQIVSQIENGRLKENDKLPAERIMAQMLGVSRPLVREALHALELLGVIRTVQGGANYIAGDLSSCLIRPLTILFRMNHSEAMQVHQLRSALEKETARLAARRCTPEDARILQEFITRLDEAKDNDERAHLDRDLHLQIWRMADNPMIFAVLSASSALIENIITGVRAYIMTREHSTFTVDLQHSKIVHAIIDHSEDLAVLYMEEHMQTIEMISAELYGSSHHRDDAAPAF